MSFLLGLTQAVCVWALIRRASTVEATTSGGGFSGTGSSRSAAIGVVDAGFGYFDGDFVITGGTGRFRHATSSGTISAVGDLAPPLAITARCVAGSPVPATNAVPGLFGWITAG